MTTYLSVNNPIDFETFSKSCWKCKKPDATLTCGACRAVRYCNKECQVPDWQNHRGQCHEFRESRARNFSVEITLESMKYFPTEEIDKTLSIGVNGCKKELSIKNKLVCIEWLATTEKTTLPVGSLSFEWNLDYSAFDNIIGGFSAEVHKRNYYIVDDPATKKEIKRFQVFTLSELESNRVIPLPIYGAAHKIFALDMGQTLVLVTVTSANHYTVRGGRVNFMELQQHLIRKLTNQAMSLPVSNPTNK
jgi:hypothetical protein